MPNSHLPRDQNPENFTSACMVFSQKALYVYVIADAYGLDIAMGPSGPVLTAADTAADTSFIS